MDGQLNPPLQRPADTEHSNANVGSMPPEAPLEMPLQAREYAPPVERPRQGLGTWVSRAIAMSTTIAIGIYGITEMIAIVGFSNMTNLQATMIVFFAITLLWIAFAAGTFMDSTDTATAHLGQTTGLR